MHKSIRITSSGIPSSSLDFLTKRVEGFFGSVAAEFGEELFVLDLGLPPSAAIAAIGPFLAAGLVVFALAVVLAVGAFLAFPFASAASLEVSSLILFGTLS